MRYTDPAESSWWDRWRYRRGK